MTPQAMALLVGASLLAGAINSVAGGGTIVSFPAALAVGLPSIVANATNAVALTPGSIASAFAYRRELVLDRPILKVFLPPSLLGAVAGAVLLLVTPTAVFDTLVPVLVLFATLLLLFQSLRKPSAAVAKTADQNGPWQVPQHPLLAASMQFAIGLYGGYFGGGMGIMMLALLGRMGGNDIHRMNGVKSVLGAAINGTASLVFLAAQLGDARVSAVDGPAAALMAGGAIVGGFVGAAIARRVKPSVVRWVVVAIGFALALVLAVRKWVNH